MLQLETMTHSVARKQFVKTSVGVAREGTLPKKHSTNATGDMKLRVIFR